MGTIAHSGLAGFPLQNKPTRGQLHFMSTGGPSLSLMLILSAVLIAAVVGLAYVLLGGREK
jgi:hypothetical protein